MNNGHSPNIEVEIKYVEGKVPFYQLNNLYVYELRCEIFRYEDELIDAMASGNGPDIFLVNNAWMPRFEDLDSLQEKVLVC